ncbi:MAG: hypothetical protein OEU84_17610 [Xanthomonadales bacterium]|nr:hypothetical protein [Xanthomonadales bacterium]MDH4021413.1 hypothetical protein [Xanthomonadales bacterium]
MTFKNNSFYKNLGIGLLVLSFMLCAACGAKVVRGASPMVRMTELSHQGDNINLQLSMRNLNGVDLEVQSIDFRLTVNEDEKDLFVYNGPVEAKIIANGTESWSVEVEESETSRNLLDSLEKGDIKSLPYALKGSVISKDEGTLRFEHEGHIYPLPGKPGHFR